MSKSAQSTPLRRLTPEEVREQFLAQKTRVGPVEIEQVSLATLLIMEEIRHPLYTGGAPAATPGKPKRDEQARAETKPLTNAEIVRLIFAFCDSEQAAKLCSDIRAYDKAAMKLARSISPQHTSAIISTIISRLASMKAEKEAPRE